MLTSIFKVFECFERYLPKQIFYICLRLVQITKNLCYLDLTQFLLAFLAVIVCNIFFPWKPEWWGDYFFVTQVLIPGPVGAVTTVWFFIGGIMDLRRLFRDLAKRKADALDNGVVEGNVSLADQAAVRAVEAAAAAPEPPPKPNSSAGGK